jgi:FkbH-like protein
MDFSELKKNLKKDFTQFKPVKVALLGDSATQMFAQALKGYGYGAKLNFEIFEGGYNDIEREIINPSSELYKFKPEFIIIFRSVQKLQKSFYQCSLSEKRSFAENHLNKVDRLYQILTEQSAARVILFNLPEVNDAIYGNFSNNTETSFPFQLRKINFELMRKCLELKNLFINDVAALQCSYGNDFIFDSKLYINADMVFSLDFLPALAKNTSDIIEASLGQSKKCLLLDLDNVLWGGMIGDDGIDKIQIGSLGIGKAFTDFQLWLKQLKERGILLAVCSKNSEYIAKEAFQNHPEMILKLEDIAVFVANWNNKIDNIKYIQSILNIGFDTMVFLDDSPFERNFVRAHFSEICVPELPEDPVDYLAFLQKLNLFEAGSFNEEDTQRTKKYQEESKRKASLQNYGSGEDFLKSVEMTAQIDTFNSFNIPRVVQLIQRSNQFNLRTIRYSEEEIKSISSSKNHISYSFTLSDKFGDYGLTAVVILKREPDFLFIDTWIMSCRIFKRGMEDLVLNKIAEIALKEGYHKVAGEFIPTPKNEIVKDLYQNAGFSKENKLWMLDVKKFKPRLHFIKIKEEVK